MKIKSLYPGNNIDFRTGTITCTFGVSVQNFNTTANFTPAFAAAPQLFAVVINSQPWNPNTGLFSAGVGVVAAVSMGILTSIEVPATAMTSFFLIWWAALVT